MPTPRKDLLNKKYGRLTVLKRASNSRRNKSRWLCQCECGNTKIIPAETLIKGQSKSCGCLQSEYFVKKGEKIYKIRKTKKIIEEAVEEKAIVKGEKINMISCDIIKTMKSIKKAKKNKEDTHMLEMELKAYYDVYWDLYFKKQEESNANN